MKTSLKTTNSKQTNIFFFPCRAKAKGCGLIVMEYIENSGFPSDIRHAWKQMLLAFEKIHNKGKWSTVLSYLK